MKIKAEVLQYRVLYHGFFVGVAKIKILTGPDKGQTTKIKTVDHHKPGKVIEIYAQN